MKYSYIVKTFFLLLMALILINLNFMCFAENEVDNKIESNVLISNSTNSIDTINSTNNFENIIAKKEKEEINNNEVKEMKEINKNSVEENLIKKNTSNILKIEKNIYEIVNFYINYESIALDVEGNITERDVNLFTPSLYESYVGNATNKTKNIADVSKDNSYTVNKKIRSLEGYKKRRSIYSKNTYR